MVNPFQERLRNELTAVGKDPAMLHIKLIGRAPTVMPSHAYAVQQKFTKILASRGVEVHVGKAVVEAVSGEGERKHGGAVCGGMRWHVGV